MAVKATQAEQATFFDQADQWFSFADRKKAINPKEIWRQHFGDWGEVAKRVAKQTAEKGFQPLAAAFIQDRRQELEKERSRQTEWLQQRSREITGDEVEQVVQISLFDALTSDGSDASASSPSGWRAIADPVERLAAFATDGSQLSRARSEADGVLRIYHQRSKGLAEQLNLGVPEVLPLGILMLIPEV